MIAQGTKAKPLKRKFRTLGQPATRRRLCPPGRSWQLGDASRRELKRAHNPFYIPFRWLLLTVFLVLVALLGAVAMLANLRGEAAAPALRNR